MKFISKKKYAKLDAFDYGSNSEFEPIGKKGSFDTSDIFANVKYEFCGVDDGYFCNVIELDIRDQVMSSLDLQNLKDFCDFAIKKMNKKNGN